MIRKVGNLYKLMSKKHPGKTLGVFATREAALKREGQIEYFKYKKGA